MSGKLYISNILLKDSVVIAGDKLELVNVKENLVSNFVTSSGISNVYFVDLEMSGALHTLYFEPITIKLSEVSSSDIVFRCDPSPPSVSSAATRAYDIHP